MNPYVFFGLYGIAMIVLVLYWIDKDKQERK